MFVNILERRKIYKKLHTGKHNLKFLIKFKLKGEKSTFYLILLSLSKKITSKSVANLKESFS